MTRWRISIDQDICVGSGTCTSLLPDFFALDEEDRSHPRADTADPRPGLLQAANYCPTGAIHVIDAETGESQVDR